MIFYKQPTMQRNEESIGAESASMRSRSELILETKKTAKIKRKGQKHTITGVCYWPSFCAHLGPSMAASLLSALSEQLPVFDIRRSLNHAQERVLIWHRDGPGARAEADIV